MSSALIDRTLLSQADISALTTALPQDLLSATTHEQLEQILLRCQSVEVRGCGLMLTLEQQHTVSVRLDARRSVVLGF